MQKAKTPTAILIASYGLSFMDGAFSIGLNEQVYTLLGFVMLVAIAWLAYVVYTE